MMSVYKQRDALAALREGLLLNGYTPLPATGKRIIIPGWTKVTVTSEWLRGHLGFPNTGIRCDNLCAIDLDCDTPGLAKMIASEIVPEHLGSTSLWRVRGQRIILVYAAKSGSSAATRKFRDAKGRTNRVEALRGSKRQFIAFGMHPSGEPYAWPDQSPSSVPASELPVASEEDVSALLEAIDAELEAQPGMEPIIEAVVGGGYSMEPILTREMEFQIVGPPGCEGVANIESMTETLAAMGEGATLQCNLTGVRPSSDSRAGLARLVGDRLIITDFVKERIYTASEVQLNLPADLLLSEAEQAELFPSAVGPVLGRRFYCEATGKGHDPDRPEVGFDPAATKRAFGSAAVDAWFGSCKRVVDMVYEPGAPRWIKNHTGTYFNLYRDAIHPTVGGDLATWDRFIVHLLPDQREREWFLGWLAYKVQHPRNRCHGVIMVAHRVFGAGRGTLFEILRRVFGTHNVRTVDFGTIIGRNGQGQYNDWISRTLWVLIPEVKEVDPLAAKAHMMKEQAYEALKEVADTTLGSMRIKTKYGPMREEGIFANLLAATNHEDAIAIPANDRRFAVLSNGTPLPVELAEEVHAWLTDPQNIGALWRHLSSVPTPYTPAALPLFTSAKRVMADAGTGDIDRILNTLERELAGDWVSFQRAVDAAREVAERENMELSAAAVSYLRRAVKSRFKRYATRMRLEDGSLSYAHHVRGPFDADRDHIRVEVARSDGDLRGHA